MEHEEARHALGAYAIGALEPAERSAVERHLAGCAPCRAELAELAALPGLLARLGREEAASGVPLVDAPDPAGADRLVEAAAAERRAGRRRLRRWQAIAGIAAAAAVVLAVLGLVSIVQDDGDPPRPAPIEFAVQDPAAGALNGFVRADPRGWGTEVELEVWDLPDAERFTLDVVARDGRREQAAAWSRTPLGQCRLTGATSIMAADIARFEIIVPGGPILASAELI
jgi:hypothetical protein